MKRLHPLTLALLASMDPATLAPSAGKVVIDSLMHPAVPTEPLKPPPEPVIVNKPRQHGRTALRNLMGQPVRAIAQPVPGDKNPEGKAAKRRRKQMERKNPPAEVQHAADSCEASRADRQDLVRDQCTDGGVIETWTDDDGEIRQRYVPKDELYIGMDPGSPAGDTTVAIQRGERMLIMDDVSPVPPEVWLTESNPQPDQSWVERGLTLTHLFETVDRLKHPPMEPKYITLPDGTVREATEAAIDEYGEQLLERIHQRSRLLVLGMLADGEKAIEIELTGGQEVRANTAGGGDDADLHAGLQPVRDPEQSEGGRGQ